MNRLAAALLLLLLLPLAAHGALDTSRDRRLDSGARLHWLPCRFEIPFGREAHCAEFHPSLSAGAAAPAVRIPVVVLEPDAPQLRGSPVLYLPAGPGDATGVDAQGMAQWWNWSGLARWPHQLVLMDARGAGAARPQLDCPEARRSDRRSLGQALDARADLQQLRAAARICYRRLRAAGIDPARFSAPAQVGDAGELMALLGGDQWNLWGVSYGTRLALHAAREFPGRVRSLILDSTYPPEVNGLLELPHQLAATLEGLPAQCAADASCNAAHPQVERQLHSLLTRLAVHPVPLVVEKWPARWRYRLALNDYRLVWTLFTESYRAPLHPRFASAVAAADGGDFGPMLPLLETFIDSLLDPRFSYGSYFSTTCPEDLPGVSALNYQVQAQRYPRVLAYAAPQWDEHVCHDWHAGRLPPRYLEPVRSAIPALVLNGVYDYITLPEWGKAAAARLPHSRYYAFLGSSHTVTMQNACAMTLAEEFLVEPTHPAIPSCVADSVAPAP